MIGEGVAADKKIFLVLGAIQVDIIVANSNIVYDNSSAFFKCLYLSLALSLSLETHYEEQEV